MKSDVGSFLEEVRTRCAKAGIRLDLVARSITKAGDIGEFDDVAGRLMVCVNDKAWLTTLAHELGHLDQWVGGSLLYRSDSTDDRDFDAWLAGGRPPSEKALRAMTRRIQRCELDAERRAVHTIRKYGLCEDVKGYIRSANFHVWQYEAARKMLRWVEASDAALKRMPERLIRVSDLGRLPTDFGVG